MRTMAMVTLVMTASCSGATFQPVGYERPGNEIPSFAVYSVEFEVSCDSCDVEYGPEGATLRAVAEGGWTGTAHLGTLQTGEQVRVVLRAQPLDDVPVVAAVIKLDGRTLAKGSNDDPGKPVIVRARIRGS